MHLGHIEYVATDSTRTTIPWVQKRNADGSETVFATPDAGSGVPEGERRVMDCIDCHNRAAHTFVTAEDAINRAMAEGAISPDLPWVHKEGLELLKANYASQKPTRASRFRRRCTHSIARSIRKCWPPRPRCEGRER